MKNKFIVFGETQNSKKIWAYYKALVKTEDFQEEIKKLRTSLYIPISGYKKSNQTPPEGWSGDRDILSDGIDLLCHKYGFFPGHWWMTLEFYVFYSSLQTPDIASGELCTIYNFVNDPEDSWNKITISEFNKFFPIGIKISPHASERDILDFIKKYYISDIKPLQIQYKNNEYKIGRIRPKNTTLEKRNDYIYKNRNKKLKDLEKELGGLGYDMDQGSISKIVSLESKRRKKV
jgi:hypothetical protein